ncbi:hypothetical protein ACLG6S_03920 [Thermodesulfobacteriota bacterium B35]
MQRTPTNCLTLAALILFLATISGPAHAAEQWRCQLDLHQGDKGILEFTRTGDRINGRTVVTRNTGAGPFTHTISGRWQGEVIEFRRTLNPASSHQVFKGIVVPTSEATNRPSDRKPGDPVYRMAGRFAFKYQGIWSADCFPAPKTFRTGSLELRQTYMADLDRGIISSGPGADIWFQAKNPIERYITPRNRARIAIAGRRSLGRDGCAALHLGTRPIPVSSLPAGTYVCVKTSERRFAQFRVNVAAGPSPGRMQIGYTTWER